MIGNLDIILLIRRSDWHQCFFCGSVGVGACLKKKEEKKRLISSCIPVRWEVIFPVMIISTSQQVLVANNIHHVPSAGPDSGIYNLLPSKALNNRNNKQVVLVGGTRACGLLVMITIDEDYLLPFLCVTTCWSTNS